MVFTNLFHTEWIPLKPIFNWAIQDLFQVLWKQTNKDTEIILISQVFHFYQPLYLLTYISSGLFVWDGNTCRSNWNVTHCVVYADLKYVTMLLSQLLIAGITAIRTQSSNLSFLDLSVIFHKTRHVIKHSSDLRGCKRFQRYMLLLKAHISKKV